MASSGFTACNNLNFDGIYYKNGLSVVIKKNVLVEIGVNFFPGVNGPNVLDHEYKNNIFIGKMSTFS